MLCTVVSLTLCKCDTLISLASSLCPPSYRTAWCREDFPYPSRSEIYTRGCSNIDMYAYDPTACLLLEQFSIDTHYIDVSRYSDRPMPAVKALFRHWFDKAAWHRPSILVLDNLDNLLSPELEVNQLARNGTQTTDIPRSMRTLSGPGISLNSLCRSSHPRLELQRQTRGESSCSPLPLLSRHFIL
jgi:hypothetical protein